VAGELSTQSPCNKTCKLNGEKMCIGCGRSLQNIAEWAGATPERLDEMNKESQARLYAYKKSQKQQRSGSGPCP